MNQLQLSKELGVSQQAVSAWTTGIAKPKPEIMAQIETLLGIPMREWVEDADDDSGPLDVEDDEDDDVAPPRKTGTGSRSAKRAAGS